MPTTNYNAGGALKLLLTLLLTPLPFAIAIPKVDAPVDERSVAAPVVAGSRVERSVDALAVEAPKVDRSVDGPAVSGPKIVRNWDAEAAVVRDAQDPRGTSYGT